MINKIVNKAQFQLRYRYRQAAFCLLRNLKRFPENEAILIFADPRGGSTWMAELINEIPRTAILWEPLTTERVPAFRALNFAGSGRRQYIPPEESWPEAREAFSQLMRGALTNRFLGLRITPTEYFTSNRPIIKFVKGNGIIPWITKNFDFKYEPIYFVRHPFATVESQLRHGAWDYKYESFSIPECAYDNFYRSHKDFLSTLHTKEEELTALWAISNRVPLKNSRNNKDWITITYENTIIDPEETLKKVSKKWSLKIPYHERKVKKTSMSKGSDVEERPKDQIEKWKYRLNDEKIKRMTRVLDYFEIETYSDDLMPNVEFE